MGSIPQTDLHDSDTLRVEQASSSLGIERRIVPRRRFQQGRIYRRGNKWVGSYREHELNPQTGQRIRRTITFPDSISSERAARRELEPYLNAVNVAVPVPAKRRGKTLNELVEEWKEKIIPNLTMETTRAALSHIRTYITPLLGEVPLALLSVREHQTFITAVGRRVERRKTAENVHGTLTAILNKGRDWDYVIPEISRKKLVFPDDKKSTRIFFFDPDLAARVISAADQPFKRCFCFARCSV